MPLGRWSSFLSGSAIFFVLHPRHSSLTPSQSLPPIIKTFGIALPFLPSPPARLHFDPYHFYAGLTNQFHSLVCFHVPSSRGLNIFFYPRKQLCFFEISCDAEQTAAARNCESCDVASTLFYRVFNNLSTSVSWN